VSELLKTVIEVDVDGVLADIHGHLSNYLSDVYPGFDGDKHIESWTMKELDLLNINLRPRIFELFGDPEFISTIVPYYDVVDSLKQLSLTVKDWGMDLVLHTNVHSQCVEARQEWIQRQADQLGVHLECKVTSCPVKEVWPNTYAIIEDNLENIQNAVADVKILMRRGHNRNYSEKDLGVCKHAHVVTSFAEAVDLLIDLKENL
jgi:5'(3')-deoxyribonucleotidase